MNQAKKTSQEDVESRAWEITSHLLRLRRRENNAVAHFISSLDSLTIQQVAVLNIISEAEPCTMSQVAKGAFLALSTVTSIVDKLVKTKLVVRLRSDVDRRIVLAQLTEQGKAIITRQVKVMHAVNRELYLRLNEQEQTVFLQCLAKLVPTSTPDSGGSATVGVKTLATDVKSTA